MLRNFAALVFRQSQIGYLLNKVALFGKKQREAQNNNHS